MLGRQAKARKLETQTKLAELRKDIEQMGKITPEEVAMEDKQTVQLQQVRAAEKGQNLWAFSSFITAFRPSSSDRFTLRYCSHWACALPETW